MSLDQCPTPPFHSFWFIGCVTCCRTQFLFVFAGSFFCCIHTIGCGEPPCTGSCAGTASAEVDNLRPVRRPATLSLLLFFASCTSHVAEQRDVLQTLHLRMHILRVHVRCWTLPHCLDTRCSRKFASSCDTSLLSTPEENGKNWIF